MLPNIDLRLLCLAVLLPGGCATQATSAPAAQASACPVPATVLVYPQPDYPAFEAAHGYEDSCVVRFDIDAAGVPVNPQARCTYRAFAQSAETALLDARFDPAEVTARPEGARCAVFPIEYSLVPAPEAL